MNIGFIHPGSMGVSIAASAISSGHRALWASQGRSSATIERAKVNGLTDTQSIESLCDQSEILFSICPPAAAEDVALNIANVGFSGIFVDANAISPQRMQQIAETLSKSARGVVDGGIIGHPAWKPGTTWLHLSGTHRNEVADCFTDCPLMVSTMSSKVGDASALKMCFAAYTKGTTALLCTIIAAAEELGVRKELYDQWNANREHLSQEREMSVRNVTAKAWRFVDEMEEIAKTFSAVGQPDGFLQSAAETYRRLSDLKNGSHPSDLDDVLSCLQQRS